jgi:hypothetical protein
MKGARMVEDALHDALGKSFITALLMTGSIERAEAAVHESIAFLTADDASGEALVRGAIEAALPPRGRGPGPRPEELERALAILPFELQGVFQLEADLRYCFVCRVLADLPREICALLLHLDLRTIDKRTCTAVQRLVSITGREAARPESAQEGNSTLIERFAPVWKSLPLQ